MENMSQCECMQWILQMTTPCLHHLVSVPWQECERERPTTAADSLTDKCRASAFVFFFFFFNDSDATAAAATASDVVSFPRRQAIAPSKKRQPRFMREDRELSFL
mmetsp:Transcript_20076/g.40528  ORF Transcript_20076/g.40528 Transcript_20076/m.40528 type:complete len:105 (+) Transcript_20076:657-971(+)